MTRAAETAREARDLARHERDAYQREAARISGLLFDALNDLEEARDHG